MPKPYTVPTLFDESLQISTSNLKEWNYLKSGRIKSGTITWSSDGNRTASVSIEVNTQSEQPYIEFNYKYRDEPRNYKVKLVSVPSNLGKGVLWYFLCPQTNKRARKLYLIDGYFLHREAFNGLYACQTKSRETREFDKTFGGIFKIDDLNEQLYGKYFKRMYAGKPTKKYLRIVEQIQKIENVL